MIFIVDVIFVVAVVIIVILPSSGVIIVIVDGFPVLVALAQCRPIVVGEGGRPSFRCAALASGVVKGRE